MNLDELLSGAREAMSVKKVFGESVHEDGSPSSRSPRSAAVVGEAAIPRGTVAEASAWRPCRPAPM